MLVFCPTIRLRAATRKAIFEQDYLRRSDTYADVVFARDNPYGQWTGQVYRNVQLNYEKMRRLALAEGYSAVWCIEDDMLPPADALSKLLDTRARTGAGIVSGLYVLRHGANTPNLMGWNTGQELGSSVEWAELRRHIQRGEWEIPISGGCQGCVLIGAEVLSDFTFLREGKGAPDMDFMRHCFRGGVKQIGRLDVRCGHLSTNGDVLEVNTFLPC